MYIKIEYVKEKGYISFGLGDSLKEKTKDIPDGYGVYIFHKNVNDGDILYIGKSGTILQDGKPRAQDLKGRLNNIQDGMRREDFLRKKINEDNAIQQIVIEWYTIDENKYLPSFIEAQLLQEYYTQNKCLPIWNKEF